MKKNIIKAGILTLFLDNRLAQMTIDIQKYQEIKSRILKFVYHLLSDLSSQFGRLSYTSVLLFIGILFLLQYTSKIETTKISLLQKILSLALAIAMVLSYSFTFKLEDGQSSNFFLLFSGGVQIIKTILTIYSWYILYETLQKLLEYFCLEVTQKNNKIEHRLDLFFDKLYGNSITIFIAIVIMWLPFILIDYPGVLIYDGVTQLMQSNGFEALRTDHPIASTIIINFFFKIGVLINQPKLGLFLYVIAQVIALAGAMTFCLKYVYSVLNNKRISYAFLLSVGILPIFPSFVTLITKDIFFAASFIVFNTLVFIELYSAQKKSRVVLIAGFVISATISMLFRKNILYVYALIIAIGLLSLMISKEKKRWAVSVVVLLVSIISFNLIDSTLAKHYSANTDGLRRESLSVPFQQTARFAKYHMAEVTEEEKAIIDKVLKYDGIEKRYRPHLSNNVKYYHNEEATSEEMMAYFKVWFNQFLRHPVTYFEATIEQNISLFSLSKKNIYFNQLTAGYRENVPERNAIYDEYKLTESNLSISLQNIKLKYYQLFDRLPGIGLLNNPSLYVILLLMVLVIGFKYRLKIKLLSMIPFIMLLSLLAGPIVDGYTRYTALFIFLAPLLLGGLIVEFQNKNSLNLAELVMPENQISK